MNNLITQTLIAWNDQIPTALTLTTKNPFDTPHKQELNNPENITDPIIQSLTIQAFTNTTLSSHETLPPLPDLAKISELFYRFF